MPLSPGHGQGLFASPFPGLYTDPAHLDALVWPSYSHWLQPWRAYQETVPAAQLLSGMYMQWNITQGENPLLVAQMLARHGVRGCRYELPWNNINWDGTLNTLGGIVDAALGAMATWGLRPLILLNSNDQIPGPSQNTTITLAQAATAGSTSLVVQSAAGLTAKFSGIADGNATNTMCHVLFDAIAGTTITLSRPLAHSYANGAQLNAATLKYRPFDPGNSTYYNQTLAGWLSYVNTVAQFVASALGTTGNSTDKGFDLEIWNELTFGSAFLDIDNYYSSAQYSGSNPCQTDILAQTAQQALATPSLYAGVRIGNGFANQSPFPASSQMPSGISALNKHPYPPHVTFPISSGEQLGQPLVNALGHSEPAPAYMPSVRYYLPEFSACAQQAECYIFDASPLPHTVQGVTHGRYTRGINSPCVLWVSEVNLGPVEDTPGLPQSRYWYVKQKAALRYYAFNLGKGASLVNLFAVYGDEGSWGMCLAAFLAACRPGGSLAAGPYPSPDSAWVSPPLAAIGTMAAQVSAGLDSTLTLATTRALTVTIIADTHGHYQFGGDGTPAHPPLFNREVFAFVPFQVNAHRFVIPYYVMTRDIMVDLAPEQYTVTITGFASTATFNAIDPITTASVPVSVVQQSAAQVRLVLTATDYPCLLIVQE